MECNPRNCILWDARKVRDYGIGEYIQGILKELSSLNICVLSYPNNRNLLPFPFFEVTAKGYTLKEQIELPLVISKVKPRIFHSPHYVIPLAYKGKLVVTIHDVIHLLFPHYFRFGAYVYARFFIRTALERADVVLTVSERSRNDLLNVYPYADERVFVVYNGIADEYFDDTIDPQREKLAAKYKPYILAVGNNKPHKGFALLKRAFFRLRDRRKDINLVFAGFEGNKGDGMFYLGYVDRKMLKALYANAECFVHPSEYEGFGFPPFEASLMGTPVLSTRVGAIDEILGDSVTYFERNNEDDLVEKLFEILDNLDKYRKRALVARKIARKLTWTRAAEKVRKIYNML